jgi:acyl-CoA thioesterase FadM
MKLGDLEEPALYKIPLVYCQTMTIRFDDLDPYGHVNASRYIDLVGSSRLIYVSRTLGLSPETIIARGCGWFLKHVECSYRRPIQGLSDVVISSWLESRPIDSQFPVIFQICDTSSKRVFAEGKLTYSTMELNTGKPSNLPEWLIPFLFSMSEAVDKC